MGEMLPDCCVNPTCPLTDIHTMTTASSTGDALFLLAAAAETHALTESQLRSLTSEILALHRPHASDCSCNQCADTGHLLSLWCECGDDTPGHECNITTARYCRSDGEQYPCATAQLILTQTQR